MKLDKVDTAAPVHLVKGDDAVLLEEAVHDLTETLLAGADRTMALEEVDAGRYDLDSGERTISPVVEAAQTPPFLTEVRVVVARQLGAFTKAADVESLVAYLADPLPTTRLVLVWEPHPNTSVRSGAMPKKLGDAVKAAGGQVIDTSPGSGKGYTSWLDDQLKHATVKLDASARQAIATQIGDDAGRLVGLLPMLEATFGKGARLSADDVSPYLGEEGSVKPWDLTDAIDKGDAPGALDRLHRMLATGLHPLQIMANLTNHVVRMVALDGAGVPDERAAAELLGMKGSTFPAKKALQQSRKLGGERLREYTALLAQADLDLRGASALPNETVIEVLVARLASRARR